MYSAVQCAVQWDRHAKGVKYRPAPALRAGLVKILPLCGENIKLIHLKYPPDSPAASNWWPGGVMDAPGGGFKGIQGHQTLRKPVVL